MASNSRTKGMSRKFFLLRWVATNQNENALERSGHIKDIFLITRRRNAFQKNLHLDLMLGQIANFCPVISRSSIMKNSTSISSVWQAIRAHYGFQSTGARFLDFSDIKLEVDERPEDLFQRLMSFTKDNLLVANSSITHHCANVPADEEMTPNLENMVVLTWLQLIHTALPALVKQRYGTELRSTTLASLKPEISQALDSLLQDIRSTADTKVLHTTSLLPRHGLLPSDQSPAHFVNRPVAITNTSSALALIYLQRTVLICLGLASCLPLTTKNLTTWTMLPLSPQPKMSPHCVPPLARSHVASVLNSLLTSKPSTSITPYSSPSTQVQRLA